ncbi:3-phosphoshikimate 1-carboxyvinyltransferase [Helicobacter muridarum]|uniref:3-phosphoshikimate 1-carboxyvinyltransferase n=1 Tax=Helicobacter muridarum TaxID=216 RepID=A0A377PSB1_9HELI|nr:3-phosphoshikimate 1-carboxyvinyltransferase [Helicobacter muridarum]TLD98589.1 3-phosphoshikimate 1-carboxyvinyltransferase [Helicobacter muridarum]STQ85525.1 3-phosphoshikimate 1-carboxyvinyltransferase [Helicobacter muridarum]
MNLIIYPNNKSLQEDLDIQASDKSLSHRACMFALFANAKCKISHFLHAEDTLRSLEIARLLGLTYKIESNTSSQNQESKSQSTLILIPPKSTLQTPRDVLYCGNSGTSMRLFAGLLSGANLYAILCGDKYLHARPMKRVVDPLRDMGANIVTRTIHLDSTTKELAPLTIIPNTSQTNALHGLNYESKISSAQVKSAMILAALQANSKSIYKEVSLSRNHTENLLIAYQRYNYLRLDSTSIHIEPFCAFDNADAPLNAFDIDIPNDPSSAFFFAVLAAIMPQCKIRLKRVMLNDTRIEAFRILEKMGANIIYENIKQDVEKSGDITISSSRLKAIDVSENIAWLIDEIPALSIAFAMASGTSRVRNASELRVKESDRISSILEGLLAFGIEAYEYPDGFDVVGGELRYGRIDSKGDHRIAMSFAIASCVAGGEIGDCECINTSFPNFISILSQFTQITKSE